MVHRPESRAARRGRRCCPFGEGLEQRLVLSTFQVNSLLDTVAVNLKSGKDSSGHITLRSAIMAADAKGGSNTIKLPSGTITLTIAGADEDASATGDLDIKGNLTIKGKGAGTTIVDGNNLDRVFQVLSGKVTISNLTIQHGRVVADGGGGLFNSGGGVTLSSVQILNNSSVGLDGGDGINGGSGLAGGAGGFGTAGEGGGIFNAAGSLKIANSTIASNRAFGGAGGNGGSGGFAGGNDGGSGANGQTGRGGNGGAGGVGGDGLGGGVFNAAGESEPLRRHVLGRPVRRRHWRCRGLGQHRRRRRRRPQDPRARPGRRWVWRLGRRRWPGRTRRGRRAVQPGHCVRVW